MAIGLGEGKLLILNQLNSTEKIDLVLYPAQGGWGLDKAT